jgi:hypothetical protein
MCVADCFEEACGVEDVKSVGSEAGLRDIVGEDCHCMYANPKAGDELEASSFGGVSVVESSSASFRLAGSLMELAPDPLTSRPVESLH